MKNQRGFTMMELITIIVILGIISAVALPRFFSRNTFDSRGFFDQVISTLRYAQKSAVAQHRLVCVAFGASSVALTIDSSIPRDGVCDVALTSPNGVPYVVNNTAGVTFTAPAAGTTFSFDAQGRAIAPPAIITVNGYPTSITVEAETGYVHTN
jgi:MSHA pilin protein MshC